jgi:hypothetical protein
VRDDVYLTDTAKLPIAADRKEWHPVIRKRLRVKPQPTPANVCQLATGQCTLQIIGWHWPALAGRWSGRWESKIPPLRHQSSGINVLLA